GELQVRGPSVFAGYWNAPERTAAAFAADGWFRTGDLARRDPASGHYAIVGRLRALIVTGGFKVQPEEVERHLEALPGVAESAVFGVPHPEWGEAVTAAVVPQAGARLEEAALRGALRERLAPYKVPKRILVVEALPRNAMGKVQRRRLAERHRALYGGEGAPLSRRSTRS
ncbi:MAG TPA: malonyl-CoA synthase, partial [Chromatiales bacterium]|nr:malonyl-CoA synthase [Chromatiales bacterium]